MSGTVSRYHPALRLLHWLTAAVILCMFVTGGWIVYFDPGDGPLKLALYHLHESTGATVWLLVLVRLGLRWRFGAPPLPATTPRAIRLLAGGNQVALHAVLLLQPLIGLSDANAWGAPLHWYGLFEVPWFFARLPEPAARALADMHWWGAAALLALLGAHVAGGLYHAIVRRDGVWQHMA